MTRDGRRPATTRSHRFQLALVHRAGQDPPYPPGSPSPGPGPTGPGPTGRGRGYSASFMLLDETLGDGDPILLPPKPPRHQPDPNPTDPRLPGDPWDDGSGPNAARQPGPRPTPTRPADTRPPRDPVTPPPPEPEPEQPRNENSRRGGQVRDVQPPPGAAVLAGAESRRDSGPSTLPTPMDRSRAPYSGWAPGDRELVATDGDGAIGGRGHCRRMAILLLPLLPLLLIVGLAMGGRHRAADQPAERPDEHPDRLGAHEKSAFRRDQIPADQLTRREPKDQR